MGGIGSGRWYGHNSKVTTESLYKIDVRWVAKQRYLLAGNAGSLSWPNRSISFRLENDRLILKYRNRQKGGAWEIIEDEIFFTWTPCNYGRNRQWFICPSCNRRVAIVYGGKYYRCRHCHNLTYSCQQENKVDRLMRKARKIRARLGASSNLMEPILGRPKNLQRKTFEHLLVEVKIFTNAAMKIMGRRVGID